MLGGGTCSVEWFDDLSAEIILGTDATIVPGDSLTMNMMDTIFNMYIDSVDGTFMRLITGGSESDSDMGVLIDYGFNMKLELSRN